MTEVDLPHTAHEMLLKLRKGAAASLSAARFQEILPILPGWKLEKVKEFKPSLGGHVAKDIVGGTYFRNWTTVKDGRVHLVTNLPLTVKGSDYYENHGRAEDERKVAIFKDFIFPALKEIEGKDQKSYIVNDVRIEEVNKEKVSYGTELHISYALLVKMNVQRVTTPDGTTFEVYGDYKNGAAEPKTFADFFAWAVENTNIMDLILGHLGMEPVEVKEDPRAPYTPPKAASKEEVKVFNFLKALTDDISEKIYQTYLEQRLKDVQSYVELATKLAAMKEKERPAADLKHLALLSYHIGITSRIWNAKANALRPEWRQEIEEHSRLEATLIQNQFVRKNTLKLAPILSAKGVGFEVKTVTLKTTAGLITAELKFTFADGSEFLVQQDVVFSYAVDRFSNVTHFYRYPTTFHDVVLPGGAKMGYPSLERVYEIFTKAKEA